VVSERPAPVCPLIFLGDGNVFGSRTGIHLGDHRLCGGRALVGVALGRRVRPWRADC